MFSRIAPIVGLAGIVVSLHGCGSDSTTASPPSSTTALPPSPPSPTPTEGSCNPTTIAAGIVDCDRVDYGSCGNACCEITSPVELSPEDVVKALNASLADGGPDGQYELQYLYENVTGFTALGDSGKFLGQVHHTTSGPGHYTDKVNFLVEPRGSTGSTITAFSLALIGGALGDSGQSYKNIIMALKGANFSGWSDTSVTNVGGSCPASAGKTAALALREGAQVVERRRLDDVAGTCGLNPDVTVPDCQNVDLGSCGNACCSLTVTVSKSALEVVTLLNTSLGSGGPDGQFTKKALAENTIGFANLTGGPPADAAAFGFGSGQIYIGQVDHVTTGGEHHFTDTLNFNIVEDGDGGASITAFSTSLIGGAYSDAGQNYKNLVMALSALEGATLTPGKFAASCPSPPVLV